MSDFTESFLLYARSIMNCKMIFPNHIFPDSILNDHGAFQNFIVASHRKQLVCLFYHRLNTRLEELQTEKVPVIDSEVSVFTPAIFSKENSKVQFKCCCLVGLSMILIS